jgi:hypothetical protein
MHQEYEEQKGWRSRLERERRNLSASVEATLVDRRSQTHSGRGESYSQSGAFETMGGTALVPPRLSLQSKVMSTVHPGSFVESATSAHSAAQSPGSQPGPVDAQQLHQMANLAQSFTSDLARYGYDPALATTNPLPAVSRATYTSSSTVRARPSQEWPSLSSSTNVPAPFPSIAPSQLPPAQSAVRQRLGGRSTRIRLEVPSEEQIAARFAATQSASNKQEALRDSSQELPASTSTHLPALDLFRPGSLGTTSARLPIIDLVKGQLEASRRGLSGTGFFEDGQCDLIITNKYVTATCVIQIMLTSNPGPVVVHYISLQPRIGFTIHLTAPTNARTSFNYIILLGE